MFRGEIRTEFIVDGRDTKDESATVDVKVDGKRRVAGFVGGGDEDPMGE